MQFAELVLTAKTEGLKQGSRDLDKLRASGARAEQGVGRSMEKVSSKFDSTGAAARRMGGALAAAASAAISVGAILRGAEQYTGMINGLRGMGLSAEQAALALGDVADIANRTRAPLEATSQLYRRVSVAAGELGASQQEVLRFTENVGLALAASGTGANEASGALLQLSQAMAGGTVRAEEFNSILEGAFPIAQAAARGIDAAGGSVGRLRQLVLDGKISSEAFFDAITSQTPELEAAFANTVPTVGQALTVLGTNFTLLIGHMDTALGTSAALASGLLFLGQNLDQAAGFIIAGAAALTAVYAPAIIAATVATGGFIASLITLRGALIASGIGAFVVLGGMAINKLLELREETGSLGGALSLLGDVAVGVWGGIVTSAEAVVPGLGAVWASIRAAFNGLMSDLTSAWAGFLGSLSRGMDGIPMLGDFADDISDAAGRAMRASGDFAQSYLDARMAASTLGQEAGDMARGGLQAAREALAVLRAETDGVGDETTETADQITALERALDGASGATKGAQAATAALADELDGPLRGAIDGTADAWADFVLRGFQDFHDFASSVVNSFRRMLSTMIAAAARNKIMLSVGMGGSAGGSAAQAATGGFNPMQLFRGGGSGVGSMLANTIGGGGLLAGTTFGAGLSASLTGGLAGTSGAIGAGLSMGGLGGAGMALGAAAPWLAGGLALASGLGLFGGGSRTEVRGGGIRGHIATGDARLRQFTHETQVRRFRSDRHSTRESSLDSGMEAFLDRQINQIQGAAIGAAEALGYGSEAFSGFTHRVNLSLHGLSEDQVTQKINAELAKMGDGFAGMLPQFSSFNELLEASSERVALTDRLMAAQGRDAELLERQRQRELDAVHEVNRATLEQIFALEDQAAAAEQAEQAAAEKARRAEQAAAEEARRAEQAAAEEARRREDFSRRMMGSNLFATAAQQGFAASSYGMQSQPLSAATAEDRALLREVVNAIREGNMNIVRHLLEQTRLTERATLEGLA